MAAACFEVTGLYAQRCVVYILKDILEKANSRLGANKWDPNPLKYSSRDLFKGLLGIGEICDIIVESL